MKFTKSCVKYVSVYGCAAIMLASQGEAVCALGNNSSSSVKSVSQTKITQAKSTVGSKKKQTPTVTIVQSLTLYKGETRTLDLVRVTSKNKPVISSSNRSAVAVKGRSLTAKRCGSSNVTVKFTCDDTDYIVKIMVKVKKSSFDKSLIYSKTKVKDRSGQADLIFHKELKTGQTYKLSVSGADRAEYVSSDKKTASVSSKGLVTAKKSGTALIKTKVVKNKKTYIFYTKIHVTAKKSSAEYSKAQINAWFSNSAFVGSSIGVGQQNYFNSKGLGFLGGPKMLVRGCYSFVNDDGLNGSAYQISWGGYTGPARYVIQRSNVKRVFIHMGTNDFWESWDNVYKRYVNFISGIRKVNPNVEIYIEASTPVFASGQRGNLNNQSTDLLNKKLKEYCKSKSDIYFIDINTPLKDQSGSLAAKYSSDAYVHLTFAAYDVWTNTVVNYIKNKWMLEQKALDAVLTYAESWDKSDYKSAVSAVHKLEKGAYRTKLSKKLNGYYKKVNKTKTYR